MTRPNRSEADRSRRACLRYRSSEGFEILVGRSAADNDALTFRLAEADDFWLHVAPTSGSHVVVRNPDRLARPPRATLREAAGLAVWHSRSRAGGRVAVHWTRVRHVSRDRGAPAGQVRLGRFETVMASARDRPPEPGGQDDA